MVNPACSCKLVDLGGELDSERHLKSPGFEAEVPDTTSLVFIDGPDDLLEGAMREHVQKQADLSASQEAFKDPVIHFWSVNRRQQMQAHNPELAAHTLSAKQQQPQEADTESCASLLQQGLRLACENCAIEALQQAKDLASAFKQPTQGSVSLLLLLRCTRATFISRTALPKLLQPPSKPSISALRNTKLLSQMRFCWVA